MHKVQPYLDPPTVNGLVECQGNPYSPSLIRVEDTGLRTHYLSTPASKQVKQASPSHDSTPNHTHQLMFAGLSDPLAVVRVLLFDPVRNYKWEGMLCDNHMTNDYMYMETRI